MILRHVLSVCACAGVVALVACSSSEEGPAFPDVASFCAAYGDALCQGVAAGCGTTADNCKTKAVAQCNGNASGKAYNASGAQDCIDKTKNLFSQKTFTADQEKDQQNACGRTFGGSVAKNGACQSNFDCQGQMVCDKGLCADKTDKKLGDACNNPGDICEKGSYCGEQGAVKFCLAKKSQGELCLPGVPCKEDLYCVSTCQPKKGPGQVCGADDECQAATTSPYCDPVQAKCLPKYGLGTESCKQIGGS